MDIIDLKFKHLCVFDNSSLLDAMKCIEKGRERVCFVVEKNFKLIQVLSDGDLRRAILSGIGLNDNLQKLDKKQSIVAKKNNVQDSLKLLTIKTTIIPVVDEYNIVIGIVRKTDVLSETNIRQKTVAIIGLGYVGLTLALVMAENGFTVHGIDQNDKLIKLLKNKKTPFHEVGIEYLLNKHSGKNFKLFNSSEFLKADIYIITVGTPIVGSKKIPNVNYIKSAVEQVASKLKKNDLVILRSTVPIGCTRRDVIPYLEKLSFLKAGKDFSVAFCPERTSEGQALKELKELPQIVGGFDDKSRELGMHLFSANTHTVIDVPSLESAEMCKLLDNTFRDTIFAYSNQMAMLSESLGLNLHELITKVNLGYKRNSIPYPSPGVGGPCLSKDPYILINNFKDHGLDSSLISSTREINEMAPRLIFKKCEKLLKSYNKDIKFIKIFIMGMAFKGFPETSDIRESTTIWLINYLRKQNIKNIFVHDPIVSKNIFNEINLEFCEIEQGFTESSLVIIMNNHRKYLDLNLNNLLSKMSSPGIFYDGWNMFTPKNLENFPGIYYTGTGLG